MLIVETIARIRREHFIKGKTIKEIIKGKTIKEIARDLKVSRNTIRKVLRSGETSFEYERDVQPRPKLGRWAADLDGLLASNAAKSAREQLTLIRIFEELRERGYDGGLRRRAPLRQAMEQGARAIHGCGLMVSGRDSPYIPHDTRFLMKPYAPDDLLDAVLN